MSERKYLSVADTAKLVRSALKETFPDIKFSVRSHSYAGGASINIEWTDGPNTKQVEYVTDRFEGSYFDSSTDCKGAQYGTLDGIPVRFGADSVNTYRRYTDKAIERALRRVAARYSQPGTVYQVEDFRKGHLYNVLPDATAEEPRETVQHLAHLFLSKHSDRLAICKSATLERVAFAGDDGYGEGTVGHDGQPGNQVVRAHEAAVQRSRRAAGDLVQATLELAIDKPTRH